MKNYKKGPRFGPNSEHSIALRELELQKTEEAPAVQQLHAVEEAVQEAVKELETIEQAVQTSEPEKEDSTPLQEKEQAAQKTPAEKKKK